MNDAYRTAPPRAPDAPPSKCEKQSDPDKAWKIGAPIVGAVLIAAVGTVVYSEYTRRAEYRSCVESCYPQGVSYCYPGAYAVCNPKIRTVKR